MSFNPYATNPRPCWHCLHFLALTVGGSAALCGRKRSGPSTAVVASPRRGCAFFDREVGVDDEPDWVPAPLTAAQVEDLLARHRGRADVSESLGPVVRGQARLKRPVL